MQLSALLLSLLPLIGLSTATCHNSGETWKSVGVSIMNSNARGWLCDYLTGHFTTNQMKTSCTNLYNNVRADIEVQRLGPPGYLSKEDCYLLLMREVEGCPRGGRRFYDNWMFSADPNSGIC